MARTTAQSVKPAQLDIDALVESLYAGQAPSNPEPKVGLTRRLFQVLATRSQTPAISSPLSEQALAPLSPTTRLRARPSTSARWNARKRAFVCCWSSNHHVPTRERVGT